jgi:hypothetical protein
MLDGLPDHLRFEMMTAHKRDHLVNINGRLVGRDFQHIGLMVEI